MTLEVGEQVGQYRVERLLGRGGMATVYKALHEKLDRHVALKLMHQTLLEDDQFKQRFSREARIIANLDHTNIVPIYDFSEYKDQPFLVMKYVEGRTLKRLLKAGPLTLDEIRRIMTPIASALDYAHSQNVLHRDIKPSNIILDTRGIPYLADFGLARMVKAGESTMSVDMLLGTPFYISPEQAKGGVDLTNRTDIYSFGIVLYELLVGRVPFAADTAYATVHEQIYSPPPPPSSLNPEITTQVDAVLLRTLAKNPEDRYETATAVMQALEMALQDSGLVSFREQRKTLNADMLAPTPTDKARQRSQSVADVPSKPKPKQKRDEPRRAIPVAPEPPQPPKEPGFVAKLEEFGEKVEAWADETFDSEARRRRKESRMSVEERVRRRVEKRMEERTGLIIHTGIYIFMNLMFWSLFVNGGGGFPWPMFISIPWGFGVFAHVSEYYNKYGAGAERREQMIQREIEREKSRLEGRKQKNDEFYDEYDTEEKIGRLRLNEDGELTDSFAEEWQDIDNYDDRYQ